MSLRDLVVSFLLSNNLQYQLKYQFHKNVLLKVHHIEVMAQQ